jgi:ATP-dependent Clp protease adaptor protein ClpS
MTSEVKTKEQTEVSIKQPSLWKVVFLNDDATPMEFVIELLTTIFKHSVEAAKEITLEVHNSGSAVVGVYTHEIAEQKGIEATALARVSGHPLQINIEEE